MGLTSANLNGVGKVVIAIQVFIKLYMGTDSSLYAIFYHFSWDIVISGGLFRVNILDVLHNQIRSNRSEVEFAINPIKVAANFFYAGMLFVFTYGISSRNNGVIKTNARSHSREKIIKNFRHLSWIIYNCIFFIQYDGIPILISFI